MLKKTGELTVFQKTYEYYLIQNDTSKETESAALRDKRDILI